MCSCNVCPLPCPWKPCLEVLVAPARQEGHALHELVAAGSRVAHLLHHAQHAAHGLHALLPLGAAQHLHCKQQARERRLH